MTAGGLDGRTGAPDSSRVDLAAAIADQIDREVPTSRKAEMTITRAIQYRRFGGPEVLEMTEVEVGAPGAGAVRVAVQAVGLNPVDAKSFAGLPPLRAAEYVHLLRHPARWFGRGPVRFPRTVARDFSGVVDAVGPGAGDLSVGDAVLGTIRSAPSEGSTRGALTGELIAPLSEVVRQPASMSVEVAASLGVAAMTACGALRALSVGAGDVLAISGAAGGVGSVATQLAVHRGATVLGIASPDSAEGLRSLGAVPVAYGEGVAARLCGAAPSPVTAFLDCYGGDYVSIARSLGVPAARVGTLVPSPAVLLKGVQFTGSRHARPGDLGEVVDLVDAGSVTVPSPRTCPFEIGAVRDAYDALAHGRAKGKLVVTGMNP